MGELQLSICIATFKRAAFIGETLDSILPQCGEGVELVLVDGASPDNTEEVVKGYQRRFPRLRYFRQPVNKGVDEDFSTAVSLAQGRYCWLMSDDDLLKPGAVNEVLRHIRDGYSLILANAEVKDSRMERVLLDRKVPVQENRVYLVGEDEGYFVDAGQYLSFIGCVIIDKKIWDKRDKNSYFGTVFIHVGVIFQAPMPAPVLLIARPLVSIRYGNAQWSARGFEIWMFKWPKLIWSFAQFSDMAKSRVCSRYPWRSLFPLLNLRAMGVYSRAEYERYIQPNPVSLMLKVAAFGVAMIPAKLLNVLAELYFSFIRPSQINLVDLRNSSVSWRSVLGK